MREVSGSTWVFQIMILFILIFACFLTLVLNYSKAYRVKNEMLSIIEKYEGLTSQSSDIINNYLVGQSYTTTGNCPQDDNVKWYGAIDLEGNYEEADGATKYYYCFSQVSQPSDSRDYIYYDIIVFYRFNLPFLGDIATFNVNGRTNSFVGSNNLIGGII